MKNSDDTPSTSDVNERIEQLTAQAREMIAAAYAAEENEGKEAAFGDLLPVVIELGRALAERDGLPVDANPFDAYNRGRIFLDTQKIERLTCEAREAITNLGRTLARRDGRPVEDASTAYAMGRDHLDGKPTAAGGEYPTVNTRRDGDGLLQVVITTFGVLHREMPDECALAINLTKALRNPPEDPAVRERMIQLNGLDPEVRRYVMDTDGAMGIVARAVDQIRTLVDAWGNPTRLLVPVWVFCQGGRHRSVAVAEEIADWLGGAGYGVEVVHLDINRPVVVK